MTPITNPPLPSVAPPPLSPRQAVAHKLIERLEAAFSRSLQLKDPVGAVVNSESRYLVVIISKHFGIPNHVAHDIQLASKTIGDLVAHICEALQLPAENLF